MIDYTLNIGDVVTSPRQASYTCYGLGSCIGLFLHDRLTGLSGGAHILLPESESGVSSFSKFYNVVSALDEMLAQFTNQGSTLEALRAKIVGGANVIGVNMLTGERNVKSVVRQLVARKIFVAALEVGGRYSRTAKFESTTGNLIVRISETNESKIL